MRCRGTVPTGTGKLGPHPVLSETLLLRRLRWPFALLPFFLNTLHSIYLSRRSMIVTCSLRTRSFSLPTRVLSVRVTTHYERSRSATSKSHRILRARMLSKLCCVGGSYSCSAISSGFPPYSQGCLFSKWVREKAKREDAER
jgi:hypothetical protein